MNLTWPHRAAMFISVEKKHQKKTIERKPKVAISSILPRKTMRNRTPVQSMSARLDYDQKPEKTRGGELVSSHMCSPETAAQEFEISQQLYHRLTGRSQPKGRDVLMYRIIQSFKPGEVTPEQAHEIACELAMRFTEGQYQFVVATHADKAHIHSHIEFDSVNLDCDGKFHVLQSGRALQRLNDEICREHGLSVTEKKERNGKAHGEAAAIKYGVSFKEQLRQTIDRLLPDCETYEEFLARMRHEGYEIKEGTNLSFRAPGRERFTRSYRLGDNYTLDALRSRFDHLRGRSAEAKKPVRYSDGSVNASLKMSVFAEKECPFSPDSIQVYTALTTTLLVGLKPVKP